VTFDTPYGGRGSGLFCSRSATAWTANRTQGERRWTAPQQRRAASGDAAAPTAARRQPVSEVNAPMDLFVGHKINNEAGHHPRGKAPSIHSSTRSAASSPRRSSPSERPSFDGQSFRKGGRPDVARGRHSEPDKPFRIEYSQPRRETYKGRPGKPWREPHRAVQGEATWLLGEFSCGHFFTSAVQFTTSVRKAGS